MNMGKLWRRLQNSGLAASGAEKCMLHSRNDARSGVSAKNCKSRCKTNRGLQAVLWILFLLAAMAACVSNPAEISEGLSAAELVQRAQEASDRNRY
jgi:hypothetical protein